MSNNLSTQQTANYKTQVSQLHNNVFQVHVTINSAQIPCLPKPLTWDKPCIQLHREELHRINTANLRQHGTDNLLFGVVSSDVTQVVGGKYDMFVFLTVQQDIQDLFDPFMALSVHNDGKVIVHLDSKRLEFPDIFRDSLVVKRARFSLLPVDKQVLFEMANNNEESEALRATGDSICVIDVKHHYTEVLFNSVKDMFVSSHASGDCFEAQSIKLGKIVKQRMNDHQSIDMNWIDQSLDNQTNDLIDPYDSFKFESAFFDCMDDRQYPRTITQLAGLSNHYLRRVHGDETIPDFFGNKTAFESWIVDHYLGEAKQNLLQLLLKWEEELNCCDSALTHHSEFVHLLLNNTNE